MRQWFFRIARSTSNALGQPVAFFVAILVVILWIASGPLLGFTNTWQLVINTFTTITTFLMVFLLQTTQNHDTQALQIKLDEILRKVAGPQDEAIHIEEKEEEL